MSPAGAPPGALITFEGLDGTGKSTQARRLARWLERQGVPVLHTRQPGGTAAGRRMRAIVLGHERRGVRLAPEAELLLMMADRAQHVSEVVRPALEEGRWVISERFADSSVAYQAWGLGIDAELVERLNRLATGGLVPDLTLWLDLPSGVLPGRRQRPRRDRIEGRDEGFFARVREGYLALAAAYPERIVRLDVTGSSRDRVEALVRTAVMERLGRRLQEVTGRTRPNQGGEEAGALS
ncbi:MAG: dTMP kinase [Limnochordaceae bacterium]|nr:dTMP kinase [Limnochordaceae bacterium]